MALLCALLCSLSCALAGAHAGAHAGALAGAHAFTNCARMQVNLQDLCEALFRHLCISMGAYHNSFNPGPFAFQSDVLSLLDRGT